MAGGDRLVASAAHERARARSKASLSALSNVIAARKLTGWEPNSLAQPANANHSAHKFDNVVQYNGNRPQLRRYKRDS